MPEVDQISGIVEYDLSNLKGAVATAFMLLLSSLFQHVVEIGDTSKYPNDSSKLLLEVSRIF